MAKFCSTKKLSNCTLQTLGNCLIVTTPKWLVNNAGESIIRTTEVHDERRCLRDKMCIAKRQLSHAGVDGL